MKALIGKIGYYLGWPLWWFFLRNTRRTKVMIIAGKEILLVKNTINGDNLWTLPGGGCKAKETDKVCAIREIKEELNCVIDPRDLRLLGEIKKAGTKIKYNAVVFAVTCEKRREIKKSLEIADADWFLIKNLPANRKPLVDQAIGLVKQR